MVKDKSTRELGRVKNAVDKLVPELTVSMSSTLSYPEKKKETRRTNPPTVLTNYITST